MTFTIVHSICMIASTIAEFWLLFDFCKAFHNRRSFFDKKRNEWLFGIIVVAINSITNLQKSSVLNFVVSTTLIFVVGFLLVEGNVFLKMFHCIFFLLVVIGAEMLLFNVLKAPVQSSTDEIFKNEFVMISSIIAAKLIQFVILTIFKQIARVRVNKMSGKVFGAFIIIPIATLGLWIAIPCIRAEGDAITSIDIVIIIFYLVLLFGNICLFYIFSKYSYFQEQRMLLEINQAKTEERTNRHNRESELEERYKGYVHDIKYYLKQITIYLEENRTDEIRSLLNELQVGLHQKEQSVLCANRFLNSLLVDFRNEAQKSGVSVDIFVEVGFKIEYMRDVDITSLLGNLLDNALEAAEKCKEGEILVELYMQNEGNLAVFRVENDYTGKILKDGEHYQTTKKEKVGHGIGLKNVERIVNSYNGHMQISVEDRFSVTILFPVGEPDSILV